VLGRAARHQDGEREREGREPEHGATV